MTRELSAVGLISTEVLIYQITQIIESGRIRMDNFQNQFLQSCEYHDREKYEIKDRGQIAWAPSSSISTYYISDEQQVAEFLKLHERQLGAGMPIRPLRKVITHAQQGSSPYPRTCLGICKHEGGASDEDKRLLRREGRGDGPSPAHNRISLALIRPAGAGGQLQHAGAEQPRCAAASAGLLRWHASSGKCVGQLEAAIKQQERRSTITAQVAQLQLEIDSLKREKAEALRVKR
eukprot:6212848-Pleurochrysis_carterae.AAC.5